MREHPVERRLKAHMREWLARVKDAQIRKEIALRLDEMERRAFVPYITRSRDTTDDDAIITKGAALRLHEWYRKDV